MTAFLIKRGDEVVAIKRISTIVDGVRKSVKGKRGKVLAVLPKKGRVLVEGFGLVRKHLRKSQEQPQGAIIEKEAPVAISNVALFCPKCLRGVRVSVKHDGDKRKRVCKRCGQEFGN